MLLLAFKIWHSFLVQLVRARCAPAFCCNLFRFGVSPVRERRVNKTALSIITMSSCARSWLTWRANVTPHGVSQRNLTSHGNLMLMTQNLFSLCSGGLEKFQTNTSNKLGSFFVYVMRVDYVGASFWASAEREKLREHFKSKCADGASNWFC